MTAGARDTGAAAPPMGPAGGAGPTPPGLGGIGAGKASPAAAPFAQPQKKEGLKASAMTNVHIAMNMLEEALPVFGSETEEGKKVMRALTVLGTLAGKHDNSDLVPAEVLQIARNTPQMGGGTDVQRMILQQMNQPKPPAQGAPAPQGV
jgi:hypothetical protein